MALNMENAVPNVAAGTVTGQHLCNHKPSISNEAPAGNGKIAGPKATQEANGIDPTDISQAEAGEIVPDKTSLQEVSMTELYDRVYEPKAPVVDGLLYPGTYIFAGSPKVGKSFFMHSWPIMWPLGSHSGSTRCGRAPSCIWPSKMTMQDFRNGCHGCLM